MLKLSLITISFSFLFPDVDCIISSCALSSLIVKSPEQDVSLILFLRVISSRRMLPEDNLNEKSLTSKFEALKSHDFPSNSTVP